MVDKIRFDFLKYRNIALAASAILISVSIFALATNGLKLGIDFTGGTLIELAFQQAPNLDEVRAKIANSDLGDSTVQTFGSSQEVLIRMAPKGDLGDADISKKILALMPGAEMRRIEFVGPQVGEELTEDGALAMLYALLGILIYVMLRFTLKFSAGAIAALVHDVIIVLGFFAVTQMEFDLPVLAAVLAVIGYSLNDTIVVFDRIRENFRRMRKDDTETVVNVSLNQTFSRTVITSLTTLLVLLALFFFGGELIHAFAAALMVGVVIGTYSSIYVASNTAMLLGVGKADLMPVAKEGAEIDDRP